PRLDVVCGDRRHRPHLALLTPTGSEDNRGLEPVVVGRHAALVPPRRRPSVARRRNLVPVSLVRRRVGSNDPPARRMEREIEWVICRGLSLLRGCLTIVEVGAADAASNGGSAACPFRRRAEHGRPPRPSMTRVVKR